MREGRYCRLYSGRQSWPMDPRPWDINITDIVHALSNLCRFNGQCRQFYSVAEHSVLCSHLVPAEYALEALLHDATEAYCGDMVNPLKLCLPEFRHVERRLDRAIRTRFGLPAEMSEAVYLADGQMVHREFQMLMNYDPKDLEEMASLDGVPSHIQPRCMKPDAIRSVFYHRFLELGGQEHGAC